MDVNLSFDVLGGKANCGKPLGPALISYGIDINEVVTKINKLTKSYEDLMVKINIIVDPSTREYKISIPKPKATELIKEYAKASSNNKKEKTITRNNLIKIASLIVEKPSDLYNKIKELEGTCKSMHIKVV